MKFGKHTSQPSEIFKGGIKAFLEALLLFLTTGLSATCINCKVHTFVSAIQQKFQYLGICVGLINETVLKIFRPSENGLQNAVHNGRKKGYALKFQAVSLLDGTFLHCSGSIEGRRLNWNLYARSNLESQLESCMISDSVIRCIYGNSSHI